MGPFGGGIVFRSVEMQAHWNSQHHDRLAQRTQYSRGLVLQPSLIEEALKNFKRPHVLDHYGCCPEALLILSTVRPLAVSAALTRLAQDRTEIEPLVIEGTARAKKKGPVPASKVRSIHPLPVVLRIVDFAVAEHMTPLVDDFAGK